MLEHLYWEPGDRTSYRARIGRSIRLNRQRAGHTSYDAHVDLGGQGMADTWRRVLGGVQSEAFAVEPLYFKFKRRLQG